MKTKMKKYQEGGSSEKGYDARRGRIGQILGGVGAAAIGTVGAIANKRRTKKLKAEEEAEKKAAEKKSKSSTTEEMKRGGAMKKMQKGGSMKPLRKAQAGKVVRTKDQNVSARMYPSINPASNAINKSNKNSTIDDQNEISVRSSGSTATKKGPFGRTVQKTTITDATQPRDMYAPSGKAYGTRTTEKDVFNKKGQLIKSVSKERDINTGELKSVNKAKFDKTWTGKKGGAVKTKMKTGGMVNSNAKVSAVKVAGSKGVKSGVNAKASAQKVAKGRVGGTSAAPKTATPKARYGMSITKMKKK